MPGRRLRRRPQPSADRVLQPHWRDSPAHPLPLHTGPHGSCQPLPPKSPAPGAWRSWPHTFGLWTFPRFLETVLLLDLLLEGWAWLPCLRPVRPPRARLSSPRPLVLLSVHSLHLISSLQKFSSLQKLSALCCLKPILKKFWQEEWCLPALRPVYKHRISKQFFVKYNPPTSTNNGWQGVLLMYKLSYLWLSWLSHLVLLGTNNEVEFCATSLPMSLLMYLV